MKRFPNHAIAHALAQVGQHTHRAAALLGSSHVTVWQFRRRRGDDLTIVRGQRFAEHEILAAVDRHRGDLKKAAAEIGCCTVTVRRALPPLPRPQKIRDATLLAAVAEFRKPTAVAHFLGCREALVRVRMRRMAQQHQEIAA